MHGRLSITQQQATLECFDPDKYTLRPQVTIQDIFQAVQSESVTQGVVPFENSTNGSVVYTLDLFADRDDEYPDLCVTGEAYLNVHHFLLGYDLGEVAPPFSPPPSDAVSSTPSVAPRSRCVRPVQHVQRVYSHPQAFGQCELFLSTYLKGVERHEVSSTSRAAELVSQDATKASAAISSEIAAKIRGLDVLAKGIEDRADNTTRFLVLKKRSGTTNDAIESVRTPRRKTLVSFTIDQSPPGALADALTVFSKHGLNLTSINSRPTRQKPWNYVFFVEFQEGSTYTPGTIPAALGDLRTVAKEWRWLGTWADTLKR
ncbi:MAG: prephenate dehydratase [Thelocarpon superellum]|nr:MAG: prephenate dehydratase [Thelocarpon superellum]